MIVARAILLAAALTACGAAPPPDPSAPPAAFAHHGITAVSWQHDEYQGPTGAAQRRAIAETGASWMGLLTTWYMADAHASAVERHPSASIDAAALREAIADAHARGLKVMLKPHVDVLDGTWRAQIAPADIDAWFASYGAYLEEMAALAADTGAEMLCVGTELISMSRAAHHARWEALIARIRARYPGTLTYAANANNPADELTSATVWPLVDVLGLDVYTPLTLKPDPTRAELVAAWRNNLAGHDMVMAYRNLQRAHNKPLIFTELGYRSADGANTAPWDATAELGPDPGEQADCYEAAYEVWAPEATWFQGLFWWAWEVPVPAAGDRGYSARGKPAEAVLTTWQLGRSVLSSR